VAFLAAQHIEVAGERTRFFAGCFGIFGHGNLAGIGQALQQQHGGGAGALRYVHARNEQSMVHAATAYARHRRRRAAWACTSSIGPGATNMVTGAATATINRLPVLLLPGDTFATHEVDPVLQQLEHPMSRDISVNDALAPVSRYFARVHRPEQLAGALLDAMRVLTDPQATGAVTIAAAAGRAGRGLRFRRGALGATHVALRVGWPGGVSTHGGDTRPARQRPPASRGVRRRREVRGRRGAAA